MIDNWMEEPADNEINTLARQTLVRRYLFALKLFT